MDMHLKNFSRLIALSITIILLVNACGNTDESSVSAASKASGIESNDSILPTDVENEQIASKEPTTLIFRDVFGEEYEMEINPSIAPNAYDNYAFSFDGNKLSYADGDYLLGVDVSHHQGNIDWENVKADGYDFAILRIGYRGYGQTGSLNKDKMFETYYSEATAAGLKVGVYFFAQAIDEDEAREEAEFVLSILDDRHLDLPVVYDPESILDDEARTDNVTGEQFTLNTMAFCETIAENSTYQPMIYANMLWEAYELDLSLLSDYPIWYADYEEKPQTPYAFEFWQYTNEGQVDGINGDADIDIWIIHSTD